MGRIVIFLIILALSFLFLGCGTNNKTDESKRVCLIIGLILYIISMMGIICFSPSESEIENQIIHDYLNGNYIEKVEYHYERTINGECTLKDSTITYQKIK